jgi:Tol biopolymer transport system component
MAVDGRIGSEIAAYRIERFVGRGGMGVVYQAEDTRLGRRVALKLLSAELAEDRRFRDRFVRESRLAASLDHPNIVPVYAAGEADGQLYVAMRYVDGTDLRALIAAQGPMEPPLAVALMSQVAGALDAAHEGGLVHRDVKAANVLLPAGGDHAYLSDFGVAKETASPSAMTVTGQLVGTVDYLAPEVIESRATDARADQYALACLLYECLTGTPPFRRSNEAATLWAHMQDVPPALPADCADLTPPIHRALAKSPPDRYATCGAFLADVQARLPKGEAEVPARPSARLVTLATAVLVASILAAIGLTAHFTGSGSSAGTPAPPPNSLVALDPRTGARLGAPIPVGRTPSAVVVSGRWVWVSNVASRTLTLVDGRTRRVRRTVRLGATPTDIGAGDAGSVWVAEGLARLVVQVFPDANRVSVSVPVPGCCPGPSVLAVAKRVVWVGTPSGIWRIDPERRTARPSGPPWPAAGDAAVDPGGNAWFTDGWGHVVYISHDATFRERHAQFGEPAGAAWGSGNLWVALPHTDAVARFSDAGAGGPLIHVPGEPTGVAFGEGAVWVAAARTGTITRINPATSRKRTLLLGGRLSAVAVGDGAVWATTQSRFSVASGSGAITYTDDTRHLATTQVTAARRSTTIATPLFPGMADWSPDGGRLAYVDTGSGPTENGNPACAVQNCGSIFTMRSDGTGRLRLTHPKFLAGDVSPRWSPDGRRIAAWRDYDYRNHVAQVIVVNANGGSPRIIRQLRYTSFVTPQLDWSPDGFRLVIQTLLDGHPALEVVNADGSKPRTLTVTEAYGPRWSPDATRIAYFSSVDGPGIYVAGVDGLVVHKLVSTPFGSGTLTWSPDGRQLAFAYASNVTSIQALAGDTTGWGGVFVVNADGTGLSTLVQGAAGFPEWVPHT